MRWLVLALTLAVAAPGVAVAERRTRVAQAPGSVEAAVAAVTAAQREVAAVAAEHAALGRRYDAQLAEIDQLKRQQASWRRDRALRSKLAASLETAKALTALAERSRRASAALTKAKALAVVALDAAIARATPSARPALERRRAQYRPAPAPKKIVLPDDALDPLADPEELDDQVAALRDAEAALAAEVARLGQRVDRFAAMAELRRQHERAESMARDDDDAARRIALRGGGSENGFSNDAAPAPTEGATDVPSGRDLAVALAAVIDARTVDALRQSDGSNDPDTRAAAARQAKAAVAARLELLRKRRAAIEARARELRR